MIPEAAILRRAGYPTSTIALPDGTRLCVLPHGGRVLGLLAAQGDDNFYWTNPELRSVASASALVEGGAWANSGGERTWLAPEVDFFLPDFPKLNRYVQPRALDPGRYARVRNAGGWALESRLALKASRFGKEIRLRIAKRFSAASNPLRDEKEIDFRGVEYAGYAQTVSLRLEPHGSGLLPAVGLWHLIQMPHGGELSIPTYSRSEARVVFSTRGRIGRRDLVIGERLVRYRMRQDGEHKISVRAAGVCGRAAYLYPCRGRWSLVIRNFVVNPSGEYVDVPWDEPSRTGFAVQACAVSNGPVRFAELEYHTPAIGGSAGRVYSEDVSQIWAFRGPRTAILAIRRKLVGERGRG